MHDRIKKIFIRDSFGTLKHAKLGNRTNEAPVRHHYTSASIETPELIALPVLQLVYGNVAHDSRRNFVHFVMKLTQPSLVEQESDKPNHLEHRFQI